MDKTYITGSTYFFGSIDGFKSKDIDVIVLVEKPKGFQYTRRTSSGSSCLFERKKMSANEFVNYALNSKVKMCVVQFLIKEFCEDIGFTINHLKELKPVFEQLDNKHKYAKIVFDSYIKNNSFTLTDEQRQLAYEEYKKYRKKGA